MKENQTVRYYFNKHIYLVFAEELSPKLLQVLANATYLDDDLQGKLFLPRPLFVDLMFFIENGMWVDRLSVMHIEVFKIQSLK